MHESKKVVSVAVKPETRKSVAELSELSGKKKYAILAEAVNLWAKVNGYAK